MSEQAKMFDITAQRIKQGGGLKAKYWRKIVNFEGRRKAQGDSSDLSFINWARAKAKPELNSNDYDIFLIIAGASYRKALRNWALAAVARKKEQA
jgi:hypothetical protein